MRNSRPPTYSNDRDLELLIREEHAQTQRSIDGSFEALEQIRSALTELLEIARKTGNLDEIKVLENELAACDESHSNFDEAALCLRSRVSIFRADASNPELTSPVISETDLVPEISQPIPGLNRSEPQSGDH